MAIFPNIQLRYLLCCEYFLFMFLALLCKWMNPVISRDGVLYLLMARAWSEGGSYENMLTVYPEQQWIPAFPIFLVENLSSFGISYESAGVAISITLGSSLPLLVFSLSQEIQHDKRISLAASFLMLFNPSMIELACEVQRDMIYLAFSGWAVFFAIKGLMRQLIWPWMPAGILGAFAILTRYEAFELFPILMIAFLVFGLKKVLPWKKIARQGIVFVVCCSVTYGCLIYIMGVNNHIFTTYSRYFTQKWRRVECSLTPPEKK